MLIQRFIENDEKRNDYNKNLKGMWLYMFDYQSVNDL